ncbi:MAG: DUF502 domain-containing protein [Candidatus Bipolaricaulota bacterium]
MRRIFRWVRRTFVSGLLALLPLGLTLYILWLLYQLAYSLFGPHTAFAGFMRRVIGRYIPGTEVAITVLMVLLVGVVVRHWVGRVLLRGVERAVLAVPGVRKLYWGTRQLAHVVLRRETALGAGRRMVLVEFPYPGSYVLGMITNEDVAKMSGLFSPDMVSVYIPTAPNPLSGWVLFVPRAKIAPVELTTEEGLSLILSGGLVVHQPGMEDRPGEGGAAAPASKPSE